MLKHMVYSYFIDIGGKFAAGVTAISVNLWKDVITGGIDTGDKCQCQRCHHCALRCEYLSEFSKKIEGVLNELEGAGER
jgi:hypothetical protein